jgi:chromosome partitioning protein
VSRNLDLAPSTMKLATVEAARGELAGKADAESRLSKVLNRLGNKHDICFIDCSPAIGLLTYNALVAADEVIIPVETGFFSLQGATKQVSTIRSLAKRLGAAPVYRLLATLHNPESALACELLEELKRRFPGKVIQQVIRFDQRLRESASFGQPIIEYAPESTGSEDYRLLAQWLSENRPTASMRRAEQLPVDSVMGDVAQELMGDLPAPTPEIVVPGALALTPSTVLA